MIFVCLFSPSKQTPTSAVQRNSSQSSLDETSTASSSDSSRIFTQPDHHHQQQTNGSGYHQSSPNSQFMSSSLSTPNKLNNHNNNSGSNNHANNTPYSTSQPFTSSTLPSLRSGNSDSTLLDNDHRQAQQAPPPRPSSSSSNHLLDSLHASLATLQKRMNIEQKVKQGAENMMHSFAAASNDQRASKTDKATTKKLLAEAQQMFEESRTKIEYIRMQIVRLKQQIQQAQDNADHGDFCEDPTVNASLGGGLSLPRKSVVESRLCYTEPSLDNRIEELRYRLHVECAIVDGTKNILKMLMQTGGSNGGSSKGADKKAALHEAQSNLNDASQKVNLLRKSLENCIQQLETKVKTKEDQDRIVQLKAELNASMLANGHVFSPTLVTMNSGEIGKLVPCSLDVC